MTSASKFAGETTQKETLHIISVFKIFKAFDVGIRSGTLTDINGHLYHIGGVHCAGEDHQKPGCSRTDTIYNLRFPDTSEPWEAEWIDSGWSMSQPKSSHDILKVPLEYCNRILNA